MGCRRLRTPGRHASTQPTSDLPFRAPAQVFAIGLNYAEHAAEAGYPPDSMPVTFTKFPSSRSSDRDAVVDLPEGNVDWEVELVVVIGREAHGIDERTRGTTSPVSRSGRTSPSASHSCTARARSSASASRSPGSRPTGPWLVTPEEFADRDDLAISCALVGRGACRRRARR